MLRPFVKKYNDILPILEGFGRPLNIAAISHY